MEDDRPADKSAFRRLSHGRDAAVSEGRNRASREIGLLVIVCLDFASQIHTLASLRFGGEQIQTLFEMPMLGIATSEHQSP